jgi:type VI secretion system protein VasD
VDHPTELELQVVASPKVNPDIHKRPSPVVVRVYELKSRNQFDANDFITLYEHDKDVLGADVLARDEFVMRPGETHPIARPANPDTKFVAVLVGFRDLEKSHSRAVVAVVPKVKNRWLVTLDALNVGIVPALGQ